MLIEQAACQQAILHLQHIAARAINGQQVANTVREEGKAAADEQGGHAHLLAGRHQIGRTGVQFHALVQNLFHAGHTHAFEQRHALAQAFLVVGDFATHGSFRNGGHFRLAAGGIGDLVYTLDVDEGGVHIKSDEFEITQIQGRAKALDYEAGGNFNGLHMK